MKIVCRKTKLSKSDLEEDKTVFIENFDYEPWGMELGREYLVMGMLMYSNTRCIYYLTDIQGLPFFYPYFLFEVIDNKLPSDWCVRVNGKSNPNIYSLWGFHELCEEENFYGRLMDREDEAMLTYFRRRIEREKELEELKWLSN